MASKSLILARLLLVGGGLGALAGCAGTPQPDAALTQARGQVAAAANDAHVVEFAQPELQQAQAALQQADAALRNEDMTAVDHYAYLASRYAGTAEQTAKLKTAQQVVAGASGARSAALVQAARGQAAQAQAEAATARTQAQQSAEQQQQMSREIAELKAKQTPEGLVLTPRDILFRAGSAELQPGAQASIDRIAQFLRGNGDRKVLIEGFTDDTGSAAANQQLSEQRADAVRLALAHDGVDQSRIDIRGMGPAQPIASNDSRSGRLINRRVRILISNANGSFPEAASGSSQP